MSKKNQHTIHKTHMKDHAAVSATTDRLQAASDGKRETMIGSGSHAEGATDYGDATQSTSSDADVEDLQPKSNWKYPGKHESDDNCKEATDQNKKNPKTRKQQSNKDKRVIVDIPVVTSRPRGSATLFCPDADESSSADKIDEVENFRSLFQHQLMMLLKSCVVLPLNDDFFITQLARDPRVGSMLDRYGTFHAVLSGPGSPFVITRDDLVYLHDCMPTLEQFAQYRVSQVYRPTSPHNAAAAAQFVAPTKSKPSATGPKPSMNSNDQEFVSAGSPRDLPGGTTQKFKATLNQAASARLKDPAPPLPKFRATLNPAAVNKRDALTASSVPFKAAADVAPPSVEFSQDFSGVARKSIAKPTENTGSKSLRHDVGQPQTSKLQIIVAKLRMQFPQYTEDQLKHAIAYYRKVHGVMHKSSSDVQNGVASMLLEDPSAVTRPVGCAAMSDSFQAHGAELENSCSICFEGLPTNPSALECGHVFHKECIDKWFQKGSRICPLCRQHNLDDAEFPRLS